MDFFHIGPLTRAVVTVDDAAQGHFFLPRQPQNPHVSVAGSFWILYNLERNQHFNRPYEYGSRM
jgi:hypothetical protein